MFDFILIGASIFGAIIAWFLYGPFAGALWSGACFGFGTMFGYALNENNKEVKND